MIQGIKKFFIYVWNDNNLGKVLVFLICALLTSIGAFIVTLMDGKSFLHILKDWSLTPIPLYITILLVVFSAFSQNLYELVFESRMLKLRRLVKTNVGSSTFEKIAQKLMREKVNVPEDLADQIPCESLYDILPYFKIDFHIQIPAKTKDPNLIFVLNNIVLLEYYGLVQYVHSDDAFRLTNMGSSFLNLYEDIQLLYPPKE